MKFGYMSGFRADLCSEIEFAKQYFDFTEITIQPELLKTIYNNFYDIEKALNGFEVFGHIHWEVTEFDNIIKNIEIFKNLGVKKITVHPFQDLSIEENVKILNKINAFLRENKLDLLIENVSSLPYSSADSISKLLEKISNIGLTLDIGHANINSELDEFIKNLASKIRHIHLHYNIENFDHLFYNEKEELNQIFSKINSFGYNETILLETFSIIEDNKSVLQEFPEIKELHIEQLKKIKNN